MVRHPGDDNTNEGPEMPGGVGGRVGSPAGGAPPGDADLTRFAALSRTREAVRARSRERWLRQQTREATTVGGVCRSLAEAGRPVGLTTVLGRSHRGRVRSLGHDFVSVVVDGSREVLIPLGMVAALEPGPAEEPTGRPPLDGSTLAEAVAHLVVGRPDVTAWHLGASAPLAGELVGSSEELAMIGPRRGDARGLIYVRLSAVVELSVSASG